MYLVEIENKGSDLCNEHKKISHQIEHLQWHLEGCAKHKPCHTHQHDQSNNNNNINTGSSLMNLKHKPNTNASTTISCQSSATGASVCRPSYMVSACDDKMADR